MMYQGFKITKTEAGFVVENPFTFSVYTVPTLERAHLAIKQALRKHGVNQYSLVKPAISPYLLRLYAESIATMSSQEVLLYPIGQFLKEYQNEK